MNIELLYMINHHRTYLYIMLIYWIIWYLLCKWTYITIYWIILFLFFTWALYNIYIYTTVNHSLGNDGIETRKIHQHIPFVWGYTLSPSPLAQEEKLSVGEMSCVDRLHIFTQLSGFPPKNDLWMQKLPGVSTNLWMCIKRRVWVSEFDHLSKKMLMLL